MTMHQLMFDAGQLILVECDAKISDNDMCLHALTRSKINVVSLSHGFVLGDGS